MFPTWKGRGAIRHSPISRRTGRRPKTAVEQVIDARYWVTENLDVSAHVVRWTMAGAEQSQGAQISAEERAFMADERDRLADERDRIADERDRIADERDQLADSRDLAAAARDEQVRHLIEAADRRDAKAEARDRVADG